jgi:hypothetical protein
MDNKLKQLYSSIKTRCYNKNDNSYKYYGARGIKMYSKWINNRHEFENWILNNLGDKPNKNYSLDRIDNNKGYVPGNLRWADKFTQAQNTRRNKSVNYNGNIITQSECAKLLNISRQAINQLSKKKNNKHNIIFLTNN